MCQEHLKKIFFLLITLFAFFMFITTIIDLLNSSGYISYDGAFYSDIALHVYNGDGLLTSISSFDQFYKVLPRPTQVYSLWPLIGGYLAHLLPDSIIFVTKLNIINLTFSFLSTYVLYFLILNILKDLKGSKYYLAFIFTVFFNLTSTYYQYKTRPYTETLAILIILSSLLLFFRIIDNKSHKYNKYFSFLFGTLLILSFMTRSHSAIFIFSIFIFTLYFLYRKKLNITNFLIIWVTSFTFLLLYFYYFYLIRAEHFELSSFLIFQNNYDLSNYKPLKHVSESSFFVRFISGLKEFFTFSYTGGVKNSGILVYLLPLTLIKFKEYNIKLKLLISIGGLYLFFLLPMEMSFQANSSLTLKWLFGHRHGILIIFLTMFSFLGLISYLYKKYKNHHNQILISTAFVLIIASFSSFFVAKKLFPAKYNNTRFSMSFMNKSYDFLKNENKRLNRKIKIVSLNSRNISLNTRALGYSFESRRENWKEYLIYKMKYLEVDYFIINQYYDYFINDNNASYFSIMKNNTPKEFTLVKSFEEEKSNNWIGIYKLRN